MPKYEEHPTKLTTWRRGEFVVSPEAEAADCTVWFGTKVGDREVWEGLLCQRTSPDSARLCAVPFWVYDLNLGDEVSVVQTPNGAPAATEVIEDAGQFTFRVFFAGAGPDDQRWRELMVELEPYECWFDVRGHSLVALSAPPEHAQAVADVLAPKEERGELSYETGRTRDPAG